MGDRVVVLEDDPADQQFLEHCIRRSASVTNHELVMCGDFATGLDAAHGEGVVLVIADLSVPGGKGTDLITAIRRRRPTLPVVVMTSSTADRDLMAALDAGARAVHTKPFDWIDYRELVDDVLAYWLRRPSTRTE